MLAAMEILVGYGGSGDGDRIGVDDGDVGGAEDSYDFSCADAGEGELVDGFWSIMELAQPVSSRKSYGPVPLMLTGTMIMESRSRRILAVTMAGVGPVGVGVAAMAGRQTMQARSAAMGWKDAIRDMEFTSMG